MPENRKKWNAPHWGKAKAAFAKAQQPKAPEKIIETDTTGRNPEKTTYSRPVPKGPPPPSFAGRAPAQTVFKPQVPDERAVSHAVPKKEISAEQREQIAQWNKKFSESAKREREQDRGM